MAALGHHRDVSQISQSTQSRYTWLLKLNWKRKLNSNQLHHIFYFTPRQPELTLHNTNTTHNNIIISCSSAILNMLLRYTCTTWNTISTLQSRFSQPEVFMLICRGEMTCFTLHSHTLPFVTLAKQDFSGLWFLSCLYFSSLRFLLCCMFSFIFHTYICVYTKSLPRHDPLPISSIHRRYLATLSSCADSQNT